MDHEVCARSSLRAIISIREAGVEGQVVGRVRVHLRRGYGVEPPCLWTLRSFLEPTCPGQIRRIGDRVCTHEVSSTVWQLAQVADGQAIVEKRRPWLGSAAYQ